VGNRVEQNYCPPYWTCHGTDLFLPVIVAVM